MHARCVIWSLQGLVIYDGMKDVSMAKMITITLNAHIIQWFSKLDGVWRAILYANTQKNFPTTVKYVPKALLDQWY